MKSTELFFVIGWVFYMLVLHTNAGHHCVHDEKIEDFERTVDRRSLVVPQLIGQKIGKLEEDDVKYVRTNSDQNRSLSEEPVSTFQPIRITFDISKLERDDGFMCTQEGKQVQVDGQSYTCARDDILTPEKKDFIVSVLLKSIADYFGSILSVERVIGALKISGLYCTSDAEWACCSSEVPYEYQTNGAQNSDFLLHVTARPTTGATIAWALPCNIDQYGRPISGQANFGPARLDTSPISRTEQVGTAIHEMTHALVFSRGRFYDFRQPANGELWGIENVLSQVETKGIYVSKLITPNVVKQVKQHFNCYNWVNPGAELENGETGSADFSSHWEKRLFANEYMTSTSSYDPVYSSISLALFEDSGWYQVSYKSAQILPWGFLEGCGFAESKCSDWNQRYICKDSSQTACTSDYTSKGYCNIASYQSSIPAGFQYFQNPMLAGRDPYADYCPFYRAYSNGDCRGIGRVETDHDRELFLEEIGPMSKCFEASLSLKESTEFRLSCYKVLGCTGKHLKLAIGNKEVDCPLEGGDISVEGMTGILKCPPATRLCQMMQDKCSGAGVLLPDGSCACNPGFVGEDCSGQECPKNSEGEECSGSSHGSCDNGRCKCSPAYTGLTCSELVCPYSTGKKNPLECSGHGSCDRAYGVCSCENGYSGKACECVPGCTDSTCTSNGICDCMTGACTCNIGYFGIDCTNQGAPTIISLQEGAPTITDTIAEKEYKFYRILLNSSSYDVTFVLQYENEIGTDVDLYGSFEDELPNSNTARTQLFSSNLGSNRDEIHLCGSLGVFPRGLNDTLRYCPRATSSYQYETPGYFYLSVLGYSGGAYTLSIETDKCQNVTCSEHGTCGLYYAGICACDRYWTGDDCSIPKCGPDCHDLGTCNQGYRGSVGLDVSGKLRNTAECYGSGECRVVTSDDGGEAIPTCFCDETHFFENPTKNQALCKELIPSISYVQNFNDSFTIMANTPDLQLEMDEWALYTLQIRDEWQMMAVELQILSIETDAMLFVRKTSIPTFNLTKITPIQFIDSDRWTSAASSRKLVLNRASSTLSSGLYYIGVYNSHYARKPLTYILRVVVTADCDDDDDNNGISTVADTTSLRVCSNNGTCRANASMVCTCSEGFGGKFCDTKVDRISLTLDSEDVEGLVYASEKSQYLDRGERQQYSFELLSPNVELLQFKLVIENQYSETSPVLPLILHRGPMEHGFPALNLDAQMDFKAISSLSMEQILWVPVEKSCLFISDQTDCYKVAVYNKKYSADVLQFRLEVRAFTSQKFAFPLQQCTGSDSDAINCNNKGKCIMSTNGPQCKCDAGWLAIKNISLMCSTCNTTFSLSRGAVKIFRVPETLKQNSGLLITLRTLSKVSGGVNPNIYVSQVLPRSIYEFTHISSINESSQAVSLKKFSLSGHYWIAIYSDYPSTDVLEVTALSTTRNFIERQRRLSKPQLLTAEHGITQFMLESQVVYIPEKENISKLVTDQSFMGAILDWLTKTPMGIGVFVFSLIFLFLLLIFCAWRIFRAPENRDGLIKRHFDAESNQHQHRAHIGHDTHKELQHGDIDVSAITVPPVRVVPPTPSNLPPSHRLQTPTTNANQN